MQSIVGFVGGYYDSLGYILDLNFLLAENNYKVCNRKTSPGFLVGGTVVKLTVQAVSAKIDSLFTSFVICLEGTFGVIYRMQGFRASLVAQWLRIRLPIQGTRVRALAREDPTCRGATKPVCHNY